MLCRVAHTFKKHSEYFSFRCLPEVLGVKVSFEEAPVAAYIQAYIYAYYTILHYTIPPYIVLSYSLSLFPLRFLYCNGMGNGRHVIRIFSCSPCEWVACLITLRWLRVSDWPCLLMQSMAAI